MSSRLLDRRPPAGSLARRPLVHAYGLFGLLAAMLLACGDDTAGGRGEADVREDTRPDRDLGRPDGDGEDVGDVNIDPPTDATIDDVQSGLDPAIEDAADTPLDPAGDPVADDPGMDVSLDPAADPPDESDLTDATDVADAADVSDASDASDADTADTADADASDAGPLPTPSPGSYQYDRAEIGGLQRAVALAIDPNRPTALVLESRNGVHRWDWEADADVELDPSPPGADVDWTDVAFAPDGSRALLLGAERDGAEQRGVIYAFDPAAWPAEGVPTAADVFSEYEGLPVVDTYSAVSWPAGELPMILSWNSLGAGNYTAALRRFDPETGEMTFYGAQASQGACSDLAPAANAFGNPGWLLACDQSVLYASTVGGIVEWRTDLGGFNTGNVAHVAAHPGGGYALAVGWSGRRVFWFEQEVMTDSSDAPNFATRDIFGIAFQPDGRRALVFGGKMSVSGAVIGTLIEYRHPLYARDDFTDVSIPSFGSAPFVAPDNFDFYDAAWRTDCDGGLLVGGKSDISTNVGMVVTFEVEGGSDCW